MNILQLQPSLIINALLVHYNSTDHHCCRMTVDSQHGYSCSYPVANSGLEERNQLLATYTRNVQIH